MQTTAERLEDPVTRRRRLIRRFEATIPLRKPLIVTYTTIMGEAELTATGLPYAVCGEVIYVTVQPGRLVAIPKQNVLAITPLYPTGRS